MRKSSTKFDTDLDKEWLVPRVDRDETIFRKPGSHKSPSDGSSSPESFAPQWKVEFSSPCDNFSLAVLANRMTHALVEADKR